MSCHELDLESQKMVLLTSGNGDDTVLTPAAAVVPLATSFRSCILMVRAALLFMSEAHDKVLLPIPSFTLIGACATLDEDTQLTEIVPASRQVSLGDVHSNQQNCKRSSIARITKEKDLCSLHEFGGVQGFAEALGTDLEKGIPGDKRDLFFQRIASTIWKSCNNYIIFLLLVSASVSLGYGIKVEGTSTGWHEGVFIIFGVIILVFVPVLRVFWNEILKRTSVMWKKEMVVNVIRRGCQQKISTFDLVLGDVVCLSKGCQIPADGLIIYGNFRLVDDGVVSTNDDVQNPFLFNGSQVINGNGRMLVTGINRVGGARSPNQAPLQVQLDKVDTGTQLAGIIISIFVLVVLFLRFQLRKENGESEMPTLKGKPTPTKELMGSILRMVQKPCGKLSTLTTSLTVLVVGIVEGLPFVVTLAITYWNKNTLKCKAHAHDPSACVNMGSVTTILVDMADELKMEPDQVGMFCIGEEIIDGETVVDSGVLEVLCIGVSKLVLILDASSKKESDLLIHWAEVELGMKDKMENLKQSHTIVQDGELTLIKEGCGVLIRKNGDDETNMCCLHRKGPATTILEECSHYYDSKGTVKDMSEEKRKVFEKQFNTMHSKHLKTIAFAYKQQTDVPILEEDNLILIAVLGLKHKRRVEKIKAMEDCGNAGVDIKLISEDDVSVLEDIARECGIFVPGALKLTGKNFQDYDIVERMDIVNRIVVMGNSLPCDRLLLVECLQKKGHVVAFLGAETTATQEQKEADVVLVMGTWNTKMARESSDIDILDVDFSFLVTLIKCGRCAYENIRKYIQLEITMIISGFLINSIATVSIGDAPVSAIQLVWTNLIITVFGGLALLTETEPPTENLKTKPPVSRTEPLITKVMWRNVVAQVVYQATLLLAFLYKGQAIMRTNLTVVKAMIFNTYVLCQVFNQFNARQIGRKYVFSGIHQNYLFWVAVVSAVGLQVAFTEIASALGGSTRLNLEQWAVCTLIGMVSWAIDLAGKCIFDFIT